MGYAHITAVNCNLYLFISVFHVHITQRTYNNVLLAGRLFTVPAYSFSIDVFLFFNYTFLHCSTSTANTKLVCLPLASSLTLFITYPPFPPTFRLYDVCLCVSVCMNAVLLYRQRDNNPHRRTIFQM